jgi:hypothetical protein
MSNLLTLVAAAPIIGELNDSIFNGKNSEKYQSLKTDETNVVLWWNKLNEGERVDVISLAVHYNLTTPNSRWGLGDFDTYSKQKRKIIKTIFERRNEKYLAFDLRSMLRF